MAQEERDLLLSKKKSVKRSLVMKCGNKDDNKTATQAISDTSLDEEVASMLCAKATPPRGSYMAQSQVLRDVKVFDKNYLLPTETLIRHLDGRKSLERSPRMSLDEGVSADVDQLDHILSANETSCLAESVKMPFASDSIDVRRLSDTPMDHHTRMMGRLEHRANSLGVPHSLPTSPEKNLVRLRKQEKEKDEQLSLKTTTTTTTTCSAITESEHRGEIDTNINTSNDNNAIMRERHGVDIDPSPASTSTSTSGAGAPEGELGGMTRGQRALKKWRSKLPLLRALKDEDVCEVIDGLYVGGVGGARNKSKLLECGITHIVNASPVIPCFYEQDFQYLLLQGFYDQSSENIDEMIEMSNVFIHNALTQQKQQQDTNGSMSGPSGSGSNNPSSGSSDPSYNTSSNTNTRSKKKKGGVFVHCYAGVSRSATLCIAYLMCHCKLSFLEAMRCVRRARPVTCPNSGFMQQLEVYEQRLKMEWEITSKLQEQTIQDSPAQLSLSVSHGSNMNHEQGEQQQQQQTPIPFITDNPNQAATRANNVEGIKHSAHRVLEVKQEGPDVVVEDDNMELFDMELNESVSKQLFL